MWLSSEFHDFDSNCLKDLLIFCIRPHKILVKFHDPKNENFEIQMKKSGLLNYITKSYYIIVLYEIASENFPDILLEFNEKLYGVSHGMGTREQLPDYQLNCAEDGAKTSDLFDQVIITNLFIFLFYYGNKWSCFPAQIDNNKFYKFVK